MSLDNLPPLRRYGQDYGPFTMGTEPGFDLGGARVETVPSDASVSAAVATGAFYYVYTKDVLGTDHWFLQGGTVTGTASHYAIDDLDLGAVGSEPPDGTCVWLEVTGNPVEEDDVLLPGFTITAAPTDGSGASVPADEAVAPGATGKKCYVRLGVWNDDTFLPDNIGNITVIWCSGAFRKTRE